MPFPATAHEAARLAALHELEILDTPAEHAYDDVAKLAAAICRTPIAIINLVDADRQWGKALVGLESSEAPRESSFCAHTIEREDGFLIVPDTAADPVFAANPMVVGDPHLRFYAGAAVVTDDGHALGSVCVADRVPRALDAQQIEALHILARQTAAQLELRRQSLELSHRNAELRRMAVQDALTGLANRTLLLDRLGHALRQRRRSGGNLGVLFCDLDGFKAVNDRLGHQAGDDLLCLVADRLADAARGSDTVARFAGDEFVMVCPGLAAPEDIHLVARRLAAAVAQPVVLRGTELRPTLSIGAAIAVDGDTADDILLRADEDMYRAKRALAVFGAGS